MKQFFLLLMATLLIFTGCDSDDDKKVDEQSAITTLSVAAGTYPNDMLLDNGYLYLVNSGDNAVQRINLDDMSNETTFLKTPEYANPYYEIIDDGTLMVSNSMGNSVSIAELDDVANAQTYTPAGDDALVSPQGIAANSTDIFVASTGAYYDAVAKEMVFGDGFVTILDRKAGTVSKKVVTTQLNPQRTLLLNGKLYVINSGSSVFKEGTNVPSSDSGVDIMDISDPDAGMINLKIGFEDGTLKGGVANSALSSDSKKLYLFSNAFELYVVDLEQDKLVRDMSNPIVLKETTAVENALLSGVIVGDILYMINFNDDNLYVYDLTTEAIIKTVKIGEPATEGAIEGPQRIVYNSANKSLYVLFGLSSRLIKIDTEIL